MYDFEHFMECSERQHKIRFYVWFVCSIIVQSGIFYILLTDNKLTAVSQLFLVVISLISFICLIGLWFCWDSAQKSRKNYERLKQDQQKEKQSLLDEIKEIQQEK